MTGPAGPLTHMGVVRFWLPLAGTWLMMAAEGPYLAALIARLDNPTENLAAFGVTLALAIIIESPVIMLMSASTALVEDRESYRALQRFAYGLNVALTVVQLAILVPFVFSTLARTLGLPAEVAELVHGGLLLLLPWPAAIGYRRFRQGLLIRAGRTRHVAYGTLIRLTTMSLTALAAFRFSSLAGAYVGALALSAGVMVEAIASRIMTASTVADLLASRRHDDRLGSLRLGALTRFYLPLALTSFIALASQPMVTFFMGQSRHAIESLAVLPVILGLTFVFRAIGLSYLEAVIALIGPRYEHLAPVRNVAVVLGASTVFSLGAIAFTPLAGVWFHRVSGLSAALTEFAVLPLQIMSVLPAFSVLLAFERGVLVHAHRNATITVATLMELATIATTLAIGILMFDIVGAVAAAMAIVLARTVGTAWLLAPCRGALRDRSALPQQIDDADDLVAPPAGVA